MPEGALAIWLVLLGPAVGSFVTALADRQCRGAPLLLPRSKCKACGRVLRAADLVPLWSYLRLKGRCRDCGAAIPASIWFGEVAGLAGALLAVWLNTEPALQVLGAVFLWLLIGLFQADAACYRLPDIVTLPLLVVGLCLGTLQFGLLQAVLAALTGFGCLWLLSYLYRQVRGREGLGFGDVKLIAGLAAATGLYALPWITLLAAFSALAVTGVRQIRAGGLQADAPIAFGCHLVVAGALVWMVQTAFPGLGS